MSKLDLSIVIPTLNESENLKSLIPEIKNIVYDKLNFEIIIIDGVDIDEATFKIAKENKVKYFNRSPNNDYGNAVRIGIQKSSGVSTLFMDGDYSHEPRFILNLYKLKNNDVVIASRYVSGGKTDNLFFSEFLSKILNLFYSIVLNLNLKDVSNSFKLYETYKLKKLKLVCNHFDIIEEIIFKFKFKFKNAKIVEIPYHFKQRKYGKTKRNFFIVVAYLFSILRLRFFK